MENIYTFAIEAHAPSGEKKLKSDRPMSLPYLKLSRNRIRQIASLPSISAHINLQKRQTEVYFLVLALVLFISTSGVTFLSLDGRRFSFLSPLAFNNVSPTSILAFLGEVLLSVKMRAGCGS